jgi:hypothetical protein
MSTEAFEDFYFKVCLLDCRSFLPSARRGWRRIACNHPLQSLLRMESSPLPPGHSTHLSSAPRDSRKHNL